MLQNWEWAIRVGIPPNLLEAAPAQEGVRYIALLTLWRYSGFQYRWAWAHNLGILMQQQGPAGQFWRALDQKKVGLYGYGDETDADAMRLIRHPWSLRSNEFKVAYDAVTVDKAIPTNVPNDRDKVAAMLQLTGGALAIGGVAATVWSGPIGLAVGGAGAVIGGAGMVLAERGARIEEAQQKHMLAHIEEFAKIYERERDWRMREVF